MAAEDYIGDWDDQGPDPDEDDSGDFRHDDLSGWRSAPFDLRKDDGDVTIVNPATGARRCFRVAERSFKGERKRVLMLLDGNDRDNEHDWEAFAFVSPRGFHLWKRFIGEEHEKLLRLVENPQRAEASGLVLYWLRGAE